MLAIYKRELKAYFTSPMGYLFIAFLLFVIGIYFTAVNLVQGYPWFGFIFINVTFVFLILVPILTMRIMAEERRQKTDQLLFTAPVKVVDVVLGKYLALLTVYAIPVLLLCLYPVLMLTLGKDMVSMPMEYVSILGFFLLGAANLAIGLFISSLTESQVLAAVLTFLVLLVCYFSSSLAQFVPSSENAALLFFTALIIVAAVIIYVMTKNVFLAAGAAIVLEAALLAVYAANKELLQGSVAKLFSIFDISSRLDNFVYGILDLTAVVYYLSVAGLFVFLTVQAIQKRRWS